MLNLYEILEVSPKASKEVIDKAYHDLAKKYHQDTQQTEEKKKQAEEKMKQINEAYEILGDEQKRKLYDMKLEQELEEQRRKEQEKKLQELQNMQKRQNNYQENERYNENTQEQKNKNQEERTNMQILQNEMRRAYRQAYNDYWKSRGYKIKEPWTVKRFLNLLKSIIVIIVIIIIIWIMPPTHKLLVDFYESNVIAKSIVDIFVRFVKGIGKGFEEIFKSGL